MGYKPAPVPKALIEANIGLAMRSPSSMNVQPWNVYVITGEPLDRIRAGATERNLAGRPVGAKAWIADRRSGTAEPSHRQNEARS